MADKGKEVVASPGTAADTTSQRFSREIDLERGPTPLAENNHRMSGVFYGEGLGPAMTPSSNSSIMGDPDAPVDFCEEWGPHHPCYPHVNPHVSTASPLHSSTRIIRIRRDWLIAGDLAPTFSNLYPEILDPAGLSEQEFRRIIDKINSALIPAFDPFNPRNILDCVISALTGWLWEDFGLTAVKSRLDELEKWIVQWNKQAASAVASGNNTLPPQLISLRQTGYMTLDIQIPDPEIALVLPSPVRNPSSWQLPSLQLGEGQRA